MTEIKSLFLLFIPGAKILKVPESQFDKAWKAILMFPIRQQLQCWIFMFAYRALKNLLGELIATADMIEAESY